MTPDATEQLRADLARRGIRTTLAGLLRSADAAVFLDRSERTLRNWRSAGRGPTWTAVAGRVYYRLDALADFVQSGCDRSARPETSRTDLDGTARTVENDGMHLPTSRLSVNLPSPVAAALRELARAEGITTSALLADALRNFEPVVEAMAPNDITRKHDGKT